MHSLLLLALLAQAPAAPAPGDAPKGEPPQKKELFAGEDWYKGQKGAEEEFVGVLQRIPGAGPGVVGFGRFNPYRLEMIEGDKKTVREVYVGGKPELLAPYVGRKVKLIGKAVDMEVEGQDHHEIWPARIELRADAGAKPGEGDKDKGPAK